MKKVIKDLSIDTLIEKIITHDEENKDCSEYEQYIKYIEMSAYENDLYNRNVHYIAGIDEAGRGPLAGPVVASCVILPNGYYLPGLNDSKKLTAKKRDYFYDEIIKNAVSFGVGIVGVLDIDRFNIYNSTKLAMMKAIKNLTVTPEYLLIDAMKLESNIPQTSIIKGDQKSISIAAASIIAKVTRDRYMMKLSKEYPMYHFENNMGYGTKEHLDALNQYGPSPVHRKSFEPVKSMVEKEITLFNYS